MTSRPGRSRLRTSLKCNSNVPNSPDAQRALGGARFDGAIVHPGGHEKRIPADSVDDAFVTQVTEFMRKMTSDVSARRVPSLPECRWCDLTKRDCLDRM